MSHHWQHKNGSTIGFVDAADYNDADGLIFGQRVDVDRRSELFRTYKFGAHNLEYLSKTKASGHRRAIRGQSAFQPGVPAVLRLGPPGVFRQCAAFQPGVPDPFRSDSRSPSPRRSPSVRVRPAPGLAEPEDLDVRLGALAEVFAIEIELQSELASVRREFSRSDSV